MSIALYIIYWILIIAILVFLSLAYVYNANAHDCANYTNPWCYNDWTCNISNNISEAQLTQMKNAGIVPSDAVSGDAWNVKNGIIDQIVNKCNTANTVDDNGNIIPQNVKWVNSITGNPCNPGESGCSIVPLGCTSDLYGNALTNSLIWGMSGQI